MKRLFFILCLLGVNLGFGKSIPWYAGVIVLESGQVLKGSVSVNQYYSLVLFRRNDKVSVYPAHRIQSVQYYDESVNINRKFISIQQSERGQDHKQVFEIVVYGAIKVLRKSDSLYADLKDDALGYDYFILSEGIVTDIRKFKSRVYPKLAQTCDALGTFIAMNKLSISDPSNVIRIIEYYNKSQSTTGVKAFQR